MERLSAQDATFLYLETPETPMHVGSLTVFESTNAPIETIFQKFRDHTVARFDQLASYRRRLQPAPLQIDHPVWVREENVDLDYHMQLRTLPRPGTMAQLRQLTAELHSMPLDRSRPLWQYHMIGGLEGGGFAVYVKVHHAAMDGVAGISTLPVTFDFTRDPPPVVTPKRANIQPESTGWLTGLGAVIEGVVQQNIRLLEAGPKIVSSLANVGRHAGTVARMLPGASVLPPRTLFNVSITQGRAFGTASVSLSDVRRISKSRLVTINDVVLAICAGALRRYLARKKVLPDKSLVAGVPATLREPGHMAINNQSAMLLCTLATDIADPINRLIAVAEASQRSRQILQDTKALIPLDFSIFGAPLVATGLAQLASTMHLYDVLPPLMNVVISNVPGPRNAMYCSGVSAEHYFPISIPYHNAALNITVQSYRDSLDFGLVACREAVPDVQTIADLIAEECQVLTQAALSLERDSAVEHIEINPARLKTADETGPVAAAVTAAVVEVARAGNG